MRLTGRIALALIATAAAATLAHALWVGTVTDDAGISLAYARTFAAGHGLRLTEWSPRVEGYSNPLWVLWLALGAVLRLPGPGFAHVSGAVFAAAAALLIGLAPSQLLSREPQPRDAIAPWLLAFDTTFAFWAGAGLETGAFALALAATLVLLESRGAPLPAAALCLLRPEGPLYVVALALTRRAHRLRFAMLALVPIAGWVIFRRAYYAEWLPNTYFAKHGWDYGGFWYLNTWFLQDPWHWALYAAPLAWMARCTRRAALPAAAACLAAIAFILWSRGDWMPEHRFAAHALPAAALAAGLVPPALQDLFGTRDRDAGWVAALVLLATAVVPARARTIDRRRNPVLPLAYVAEQGRWFRDAAHRLGLVRPRIAHFDIGGVALESGGEVIDLAGLADRYIGRVGYRNERAVKDYVFDEVRPHFINVHGPCEYLKSDPRMERDYLRVATGLWGENWARKALELDGLDDTTGRRIPQQSRPDRSPARR